MELLEAVIGTVRNYWKDEDSDEDSDGDSDDDSDSPNASKEGGSIVEEILWRIISPVAMRQKLFIISCIAVSIDPFFFYIPIIDEENKCLGIDKKLRTAVLCLRALPDAAFAVQTIISGFRMRVHREHPSPLLIGFVGILIAVFLMLPIPQVAIIVFFFKSGGFGNLSLRVTVNVFLFIYYLARVFLIYRFSKNLKHHARPRDQAVFNFLFYIVASHVFGGFWYFFSIQREISCWENVCTNNKRCGATYYCSDNFSRDIKFLNQSCPINPPNATVFNFGIFLDAIQSGSTRSILFPTKFFYCLWWGVRNLSNFGTNLQTSSYVWENCFAVLISIIGMLLFLYLLGNLQVYMQQALNKSLAAEAKADELKPKIRKKKREIGKWMLRNGISRHMRAIVMRQIIRNKLEESINAEVDVKYIFSVLKEFGRNIIQFYFSKLCMEMLKKVNKLQNMDDEVLQMICEHLKPKIFGEKEKVVEAGQPLNSVLIIIAGSMQAYLPTTAGAAAGSSTSTSTNTPPLEKGMIVGEQLLDWAAETKTFNDRPQSDKNVQCLEKVEAFALTVEDLKTLVLSKRIFERNSEGEV